MEVHEFAFGRDYVEDAVCPVVAHQGTGPVDIQLDAAEWYDKKAQEMVGDESGVISKEQAREAWSRAIDALRESRDEYPEESDEWHYMNTVVRSAVEVEESVF